MSKFIAGSLGWLRKSNTSNNLNESTNNNKQTSSRLLQSLSTDTNTPSTAKNKTFRNRASVDLGEIYNNRTCTSRIECCAIPEDKNESSGKVQIDAYSIDDDSPEIVGGPSVIFCDKNEMKKLAKSFPPRLACCFAWHLVFSTERDGYSLNNVYRQLDRFHNVDGHTDMSTLLLVTDTDENTFGALVSDTFRIQEHFYGTGQSFLFRLRPDYVVYPWSSENNYFISCCSDSLGIGSGQGQFGITIDSDLYRGRTDACSTFNNQPLCPNQDFVIKHVEIWKFV